MSDCTKDMSWRGIAVLWIVVIGLCAVLYRTLGCQSQAKRSPDADRISQEMKQRLDKFEEDLNHPMVSAAFHAGYAFGEQHKKTGLSKLPEQELDAMALRACLKLDVPADVKGHAVRKFKSGYGWGFWNTH